MHPKRPNPKIPKNRKKCIFFKKSTFSKWPAYHHGWSKTGPNDPPKCSKHIPGQYLVFIPILDYFWKTEIIDFWNFFPDHASTKSAEFHFSGRKSVKYYGGSKKHIGAPFRKISFGFVWGFSVSTIKNIYIDQFGQNPIFDI